MKFKKERKCWCAVCGNKYSRMARRLYARRRRCRENVRIKATAERFRSHSLSSDMQSAARAFLPFFKLLEKPIKNCTCVRRYDWRLETIYILSGDAPRQRRQQPHRSNGSGSDFMCNLSTFNNDVNVWRDQKRRTNLLYAFVHTFQAICSSLRRQGEMVNGAELHDACEWRNIVRACAWNREDVRTLAFIASQETVRFFFCRSPQLTCRCSGP